MPSKDSNQPALLHSLIRIITWCILNSQGCKVSYADSKDWSDYADVQTDLSLRWTHMSEGTFSHVVVYILFEKKKQCFILFFSLRSPLSIATDKALFFIQKMLISFLFLHENICCGYSLEAPRWGASNEYHNICFRGEIRKLLYGYPLLSVAMLI